MVHIFSKLARRCLDRSRDETGYKRLADDPPAQEVPPTREVLLSEKVAAKDAVMIASDGLSSLGFFRPSCAFPFHTGENYGSHGDCRLRYGHALCFFEFDRNVFVKYILWEFTLRQLKQKRTRMLQRIDSLRPLPGVDDTDEEGGVCDLQKVEIDYSETSPLLFEPSDLYDQAESNGNSAPQRILPSHVIQSKEKDVMSLEKRVVHAAKDIHWLSCRLDEMEMRLPTLVKLNLISIRNDPMWYMKESLVKDCADRGGCCGRNCGCCELRARHTYETGIGHCTVECSCCFEFRGFAPSSQEAVQTIRDMDMSLKHPDAAYLVRLANGFFCMTC
ncbi:hypothetical protein N7539_004367 [Penicillium diatomitis]|uniref:Uncharacterized protein n=1 Tax=Penicillium diatomitis TaxID=2819901 RepID=A0A9X0BYQ7_9EURO|nr:uncharacterized protein N7539_004367 [Penicillium diatomitis]KAJ5489477.1 hypothetical protein N7539_004367 [Penicillium diatomitis]